jgi:hypothetical protein
MGSQFPANATFALVRRNTGNCVLMLKPVVHTFLGICQKMMALRTSDILKTEDYLINLRHK